MTGAPGGLSSSSAGGGWRSEEDYVFARLAVSMGHVDRAAVGPALQVQGQALLAGQPLTLGQVLLRQGLLSPHSWGLVNNEMLRCYHRCPACGAGLYAAPGPDARQEPCRRCGQPIVVPSARESLSGSVVIRRQDALKSAAGHGPAGEGQAAPQVFSGYVLESEIARGGMGAIYRVHHATSGKPYALKLLLAGEAATPTQVHRFKREARAQQELTHPNIVKIHEAGEWEGVLYCTMDLVEGRDLGDAQAELPLRRRMEVLAAVCRAVAHAHEQGYVHRDLKPANVLIDAAGTPLVTDFGLAKNIDGTTQLTQEGMVLGTPYYMAPEQATGQVDAMGPRADIFSLGVMLYELATGKLPFVAERALELYRMIIEMPPEPFASSGVQDADLEGICHKAMEKDPELRYPTASAMADDLEAWLRGEKPSASHVSSAARLARRLEKNKRSAAVILGTVAVGLLLLSGLAVAAKFAHDRWTRSRALAEQEAGVLEVLGQLDQAVAGARTSRPGQACDALGAALAAARARAEAGPPTKSSAELAQRYAAAALAWGDLALEVGYGVEARALLEALDRAGEALAPDDRPHALALRVRARWRIGDGDGATAALEALHTAAPAAATTALLDAEAALRAGTADAAAERLEAAVAGGVAAPEVGLLRARLALARGDLDAAAGAAASAVEAARRPGLVARTWGERLLAVGTDAARLQAPGAFSRALELDPLDDVAARHLVTTLLDLGRPTDALRALDAAAKQRSEPDAFGLLRLRVRLVLGDPDAEAELAQRAGEPAGALLAADLRAVRGEPRGDAAPPADAPPAARAAWARATAASGQAASLEGLADVAAAIPADRAADPELARAIRDLGWVARAAGDEQLALAAAEAAVRSRPGDLDAHLLRTHLRADARPALDAAAATAAEALDGALARGTFLAYHGRLPGREPLKERAIRLLEVAAADAPAWSPAALTAAELAGREAPEQVDALAVEVGSLWFRAPTPFPTPTPEAEAAADAKWKEAIAQPETLAGAHDAIALLTEGLALDPTHAKCQWERSELFLNVEGDLVENYLDRVRYWRIRPGETFFLVHLFRLEWRQAHVSTSADVVGGPERLSRGPHDDPIRSVMKLMTRYMGLLYPDEDSPRWPRSSGREVRRLVDSVLRRDPRMVGLLYLRAHTLMLDGFPTLARRDLALAGALIPADQVGTNKPAAGAWHTLYTIWILAPDHPKEAMDALASLPRELVFDKKPKIAVKTWRTDDPRLQGLRGRPAWDRRWEQLK